MSFAEKIELEIKEDEKLFENLVKQLVELEPNLDSDVQEIIQTIRSEFGFLEKGTGALSELENSDIPEEIITTISCIRKQTLEFLAYIQNFKKIGLIDSFNDIDKSQKVYEKLHKIKKLENVLKERDCLVYPKFLKMEDVAV